MPDPNLYALSIELQLNTGKVYKELDQLGNALTNVEKNISESANRAFNNIKTLSNQINISLSDINKLSLTLNSNIDNLTHNIKTNDELHENSFKIQQKSLDLYQQFKKIYDSIFEDEEVALKREELKQSGLEEQLKSIENIKNAITGKNAEEQLGLHDNLETINNIENAIKQKNKGHVKENNLVNQESNILKSIYKQMGDKNKRLKTLGTIWSKIIGPLKSMYHHFASAVKGAEEFVTTNYRAYGSQMQLLAASQGLSGALGISLETAIAVNKALINIATPKMKESFEDLAIAVGKYNRITGVNIPIIAMYIKNLKMANFTHKEIEIQLAKNAEAMRKYGLNTEEVSKIINKTGEEMYALNILLGGDKQEIKKFEDLSMVLAGITKQAGLSVDSSKQLMAQLADSEGFLKLTSQYDTVGEGTQQFLSIIAKAGKEFDDLQKMIYTADSEQGKRELLRQFEDRAKELLGSRDAAFVAIESYKKLEAELNKFGGSLDNVNDVLKALAELENKQLAEANDNLTRQLAELGYAINSILSPIMIFFADSLKEVLIFINPYIKYVAELVKGLVKFVKELEETNSTVATVIKNLKLLTGTVLIALVPALLTVGWVIGGLASIFTWFGTVIGVGLSGFISTGLDIISNAIRRLAAVVSQNIVPILVLATAFALVGAGAYLFAEAVKSLSEVGDQAANMMLGMVLAILTIAGSLTFIGLAANGAVPGLLAIAAVMLAVGAAAYLMAKAIEIGRNALIDIIEIASTKGKDLDMLMFGGELVIFAAELTVAAAVLIIAGSLLYAASWSLYMGLGNIMKTISRVTDKSDDVSRVSKSLIEFSDGLTALSNISILGINRLADDIRQSLTNFPEAVVAFEQGLNKFKSLIEDLAHTTIENLKTAIGQLAEIKITAIVAFADGFLNSIRTIIVSMQDTVQFTNNVSNLTTSLNELSTFLNSFSLPADKIGEALNKLDTVFADFGSKGITIGDDIANLSNQLNEYANMIENVAERISVAIESKAIPAIRSVQKEGLNDVIKSEAINTVQVMNESEGGEINNDNDYYMAMIALLTDIKGSIATMAGVTGGTAASDIFKLLQQYLPTMNVSEQEINSLNSWTHR